MNKNSVFNFKDDIETDSNVTFYFTVDDMVNDSNASVTICHRSNTTFSALFILLMIWLLTVMFQ